MKSEQEKADWEFTYPQDSECCPECPHGQVETQEFGQGLAKEIWAWCVGLNGNRCPDDEDEAEEGDGCGWSGVYYPNKN